MNKSDIRNIVKSEIRNFVASDLDMEVAKNLKRRNSDSRKEVIEIVKSGIEAVYKVLWMKRDFWKTDIR